MARVLLYMIGAISLCWVNFSTGHAEGSESLRQLKENYREILLRAVEAKDSLSADLGEILPETEMSDQVVVELHQRYPFDLVLITDYLSTLNPDGQWRDINYADTKRSGWEPKLHADRVLELAKLYHTPGTAYYHSDEVEEAIHRALHYWFTAKPRCLNWWYNQIGVPKTFGPAFILMEEQLSEEEKASAIRLMEEAKFGMTGQNKVWLAGNVLIRALLEDDATLVRAARDTIASEIRLGEAEGIQPDWSFHQHGPQLQFGNYGLSFVTSMAFFSRLFSGTEYAFEAEKAAILTSLVEKGFHWTIWHRTMDINALGRQFFHNAPLHKAYALAFAAADLGLQKGFPRNANTLVGHKHFDDSDYTVHRTHDWMASLRMSSLRVIGTEHVNEDNLLGYYLGDGATYFYTDAREYLNVFPFWDWRKVPGVTSYEALDSTTPFPDVNRTGSRNESNLVGGLTVGERGLSAMELRRDGLHARKAWLFTDSFVLCLGAGIASDSSASVTTSLDQCLLQGEAKVWDGQNWQPLSGAQSFAQPELRLYHKDKGYIVFSSDTCVVEAMPREGQWRDFMGMYSPATVRGATFLAYLRHGARPSSGSYAYLVLPHADLNTVSHFDRSCIRLLQNDNRAQVVYFPEEAEAWAAVYEPGELMVEGQQFKVTAPGLYYFQRKGGKWTISAEKPFRI